MVITMDKDFGELIFNSGLNHNGILLLRLEAANSTEKVQVLKTILENYYDKLNHHFCVYKDGKLRIH